MRTIHLVIGAIVVIVAGVIGLYLFLPEGPPSDDIADKAAAALRAKLPGYEVGIADSQTLVVRRAQVGEMPIPVVNLRRMCTQNPAHCDAEIKSFGAVVAGFIKQNLVARTPAMLRIVVRRADEPESSDPLVSAPIAANLMMLCAFDLPDAVAPAHVSDVRKLGLTPAQALARCKANTAASLPLPVHEVQPIGPHSLGRLTDGYYTASQFAFPERWDAVNDKLAGKLIVVVVGTNLIVYGRADSADDIDAVRQYAAKVIASTDLPISTTVYRWTRTGWQTAE